MFLNAPCTYGTYLLTCYCFFQSFCRLYVVSKGVPPHLWNDAHFALAITALSFGISMVFQHEGHSILVQWYHFGHLAGVLLDRDHVCSVIVLVVSK